MRRDTAQPRLGGADALEDDTPDSPLGLRMLGALLCLGVAAIHIVDQGGLPGRRNRVTCRGLYYALELGGVLTAAALLAPRYRVRWLLALSVAVGPIVGYILSRGPGAAELHR